MTKGMSSTVIIGDPVPSEDRRMTRQAWTVGNWNAWVESGTTRDERAARLEQVPDNMRDEVYAHVRCAFRAKSERQSRRVEQMQAKAK